VSAAERHYTVREVAALWGLCADTVRSLFADEPGVLRLGHGDLRTKRKYVGMRIPESVLQRVHARALRAR
jgi:hypothetical protein